MVTLGSSLSHGRMPVPVVTAHQSPSLRNIYIDIYTSTHYAYIYAYRYIWYHHPIYHHPIKGFIDRNIKMSIDFPYANAKPHDCLASAESDLNDSQLANSIIKHKKRSALAAILTTGCFQH